MSDITALSLANVDDDSVITTLANVQAEIRMWAFNDKADHPVWANEETIAGFEDRHGPLQPYTHASRIFLPAAAARFGLVVFDPLVESVSRLPSTGGRGPKCDIGLPRVATCHHKGFFPAFLYT